MTVKRALKELRLTNPLVRKIDGEEALEYLRGEGNDLPCLILLDLNMPKMNGIEFLRVVKTDRSLKKIPVVVLTASEQESDKIDSFALSVAGYMAKPTDYKKFVETIKMIDLYWTLSELPSGD
ncbi:MAG: response regulator [Planctomycetota bacterium]|nr:MAG: response regulator [Planctomycetota bacterium]